MHDNCRLVAEANSATCADAPPMTVCEELYALAMADGFGNDDLRAVLRAFSGNRPEDVASTD